MIHELIGQTAYMPHGYCLLWQPWLIALHAGSDALIFAAYFAIPVAIWIFLSRRKDAELRVLAIFFGVFIFMCGLTHLMQVLTLWVPVYEIQGWLKLLTAAVSLGAAFMIFPLIPYAVAIPSPSQLKRMNDGLEDEIARHRVTLAKLGRAKNDLEARVDERTSELAAAKARFETLVLASAEVVWTANERGEKSTDSPSWRQFTGQTFDEYRGWGWLDAVHPDDRAGVAAAWKRAVAARKMFEAEFRLRHVSGDWRWTAARAAPLLPGPMAAPEWIGMNTDITQRKNAELALRESEESLKEAQQIAEIGSWCWDLSSNALHWSEGGLRILGRDPALPPPSLEEFLAYAHPDDRRKLQESIEQLHQTGKPALVEYRILRADGKLRYIDARGRRYDNAEGRATRLAGTVHDITERKKIEDELRKHRENLEELVESRTAELAKAYDRLKLANREMEAFSYSVSHDLRVPLRAIDGFSQALLEDYSDKLDADGARLINVVHENTVKMGKLIDDILAFSRVGRAELTQDRIDMDAMARACLSELEMLSGEHKVSFRVASSLPAAEGDPAMMRRVWTNLIENAIKYSGKNPEASIEIGSASTRGNAENVYYVKDNGAGFDMQYADKLFGVFQRLHSSEFHGTGIGLAIVKRIIMRHGGRVWAEGKVNEGATFYFALPAVDGAQGSAEENAVGNLL